MYRVASGTEVVEIPKSLSTEGRNFLTWCFKRDPNDRATTKYLLEHPFTKLGSSKGLFRKAPPPPPRQTQSAGAIDMCTIAGGMKIPAAAPSNKL